MDEISEDVMSLAVSSWNALPVSHVAAMREPIVIIIARAIAAERKRCADVAYRNAPATQDFADAPLQELARRIAKAIEAGQ